MIETTVGELAKTSPNMPIVISTEPDAVAMIAGGLLTLGGVYAIAWCGAKFGEWIWDSIENRTSNRIRTKVSDKWKK